MSDDDGPGAITPYLTVKDGKGAAEFYAAIFGAKETFVRHNDDGRVAHMTMSLNEGTLMLADTPDWGRWPAGAGEAADNAVGWLAVWVPDCDATFEAAVAAGATADLEPENRPWGERYARFRDPFGQLWSISGPPR